MPRFSILTPTHRPEAVAACIASVAAQSFNDFEHIVLDNGVAPVDRLIPDDPRWRYIRGLVSGPADAFQQALELAVGEIVHPLSDDDTIEPDALEVVAAEIGDAEWLYARTVIHSEDGRVLFHQGRPFSMALLRRRYYLGGAVYWRRSLSDRVGGFDPALESAADWDLYLRFAEAARPRFVSRILYNVHDHPAADSRANATRQAASMRCIRRRAQQRATPWERLIGLVTTPLDEFVVFARQTGLARFLRKRLRDGRRLLASR